MTTIPESVGAREAPGNQRPLLDSAAPRLLLVTTHESLGFAGRDGGEALGQRPDQPTDQDPGNNDQSKCQRSPRSHRRLGCTSLVRCSKETQLFTERKPAVAEGWLSYVLVDRRGISDMHSSDLL